jgi:hypothetical protein
VKGKQMLKETFIDRFVGQKLEDQNKVERANHKSSGKLSASMLGQPLQWQILKTMGIPQREINEYTLRKFKRGKDIEDWLVKQLDGEEQVFTEYRDTIGFIDKILTQDERFDFKLGKVPHEIKSVSNAKFKRILSQGADRGHKLQAGFYALGLGVEYYAIDYIASDDLRIETYIYEVKDIKDEIDEIITKYQEQLKSGIVPVFEPIEKWQADIEYNNYPEWSGLNDKEIANKLKEYNVIS